ncbi:MAG: C39 family peptidase [Chloroflexota bacterium]
MKQQHGLTCESSAASMATRGVLSESRIMAAMPRSWNPNMGFRGNPDGYEHGALVDYGVYAAPVGRALLHYGYRSRVMTYVRDRAIKASIRRGWPVVAWVTYQLKKETPRLGSAGGVSFELVPHEHAVLIVGFDNRTIIANDPWDGTVVRYYWRDFNRSWGYFGNMALSVEPCLMAKPVTQIQLVSKSAAGLTWSWNPVAHAAHYAVTVIHRDTAGQQTIFQSAIPEHTLTLVNPEGGSEYEIDIQSIDACGTASTANRFFFELPKHLARATPTPAPTEVTTKPTRTPTPPAPPPATPSPTSIPTVTSTPTPIATKTG